MRTSAGLAAIIALVSACAALAACERIQRARGLSADSVRIEIPGFTDAAPRCDTTGQGRTELAEVFAAREYEGTERLLVLPPGRRWDARARRFVPLQRRTDSLDVAWYWSAGDSSSQEITGSVGPHLFVASRFDRPGKHPSPSYEFAVVEMGRGPVELLPTAKRTRIATDLRAAAGAGPADESDSVPRSAPLLRPSYASGRLELRYELVEDSLRAQRAAGELPAALRPFAALPGTVRAYWSQARPSGVHGWSLVDAPANMRWRLLRDFQLATIRSEELAAGESDFLVWSATSDGFTTHLIRGVADRYRVLGRSEGIWLAARGRIWRLARAQVAVAARPRCPSPAGAALTHAMGAARVPCGGGRGGRRRRDAIPRVRLRFR